MNRFLFTHLTGWLVLVSLAVLPACIKVNPQIINAKIVKALDGDTLLLEDNRKVKLIGVDCPEIHPSRKDQVRSFRKGISAEQYDQFRQKSLQYTQEFLNRENIRLETDPAHKGIEYQDFNGRVLAYVFSGESMLNERILREGICVGEFEIRFSQLDEFRKSEDDARKNKRGIWE